MKICLVNSFYPPYIGGAETYTSNVAKGLAREGHEVAVFCSGGPLPAGTTFESGVKVTRMSASLALYGAPIARFPFGFLKDRYDIVHCNFPNPYFTAVSAVRGRITSTPAVLTWHNDLPPVTRGASLLVGAHDILSRVYLRAYQRIIATTGVYARLSRVLKSYHEKVSVVPNGVDTSRFNPKVDSSEIKRRYKLEGFKTLIFVGALTTWHAYKGVDILIRAFSSVARECSSLKLLVVGGGNMRASYGELARKSSDGSHVIFTGPVSDEELPAYYAASDFAVLPSKDSSEGFGLVLLEAMASGKAVIGSEVGGVPDVVENLKNGLLVPPNSVTYLASAIRRLYLDDQERLKMGAAGRAFALKRDWQEVVRQTVDVYKAARRESGYS